MSRNFSWYKILLDTAQISGVELPWSEIDVLDENAVSALGSWIEHNLHQAEGLTTEELAIWQIIGKERYDKRSQRVQDDATKVHRQEYELQHAIRLLEQETRKIRNKSDLLRSQYKYIQATTTETEPSIEAGTSFKPALADQIDSERQQLYFMHKESEAEIENAIHLNQHRLTKSSKAVPSSVQEKLKLDDRVLNALSTSVLLERPMNPTQKLQTQSMLDVLQRATVTSLKDRLDRMYLEQVRSRTVRLEHTEVVETLEQIQTDLQSLYVEIGDVATLLVDYDHGRELRAIEKKLRVMAEENSARSALTALKSLENLTLQAEQMATPCQALQASSMVCKEIEGLYLQIQAQIPTRHFRNGKNNAQTQDSRWDALFPHLKHHSIEGLESMNSVGDLRVATNSISGHNQSSLTHITERTRSWTQQMQQRSESLLTNNDSYLTKSLQKSKALDNHISYTKAKLGTVSDAVQTTITC